MYRESPSELDNFSVMTIPFEMIQTPFLIIGETHFLLKSNWWLYLHVRDSVCVLKSHHVAPIKRSNEQPSEAPTKKLRGEEFSDEIDSRISLAGEGKQKKRLLWIKRYIPESCEVLANPLYSQWGPTLPSLQYRQRYQRLATSDLETRLACSR